MNAYSLSTSEAADKTMPKIKEVSKPDFSTVPIFRPCSQPPVPENFIESPFIDPAPLLITATTSELKHGYILFSRPITKPVYQTSHPQPWERTEKLSAFATIGEYEPLTFSLYPLRNIDNLRIKVSVLRSDNSVINNEHLDLRALTYWNIRYPRYTSAGVYRATPELLEKVNSINLTKSVCQRFWLKVHIPENAVPGLYKGHITIYETGAETGIQLPISIRVLGYKLKRDPQKRYSVYYYDPDYEFGDLQGEERKTAQRKEFATMRSYGIDMFPVVGLTTKKDNNGNLQVYTRNEATVNLMLEAGFKGPIPISGGIWSFYSKHVPDGKIGSHWHVSKDPPDDKIYKDIERAFKNLKKRAEKRGWPELICCPLDEVAPASAEFAAKVYAAIRRAGLKTYITKNPASVDADIYRKYDAIDAWCSQPFAIPYDKVIADTKYQYWTYPNHNAGEQKDRVIMQKGGRMTYGFGLWKSGYTTVIPWHWRWRGATATPMRDYLADKHVSGCGVRLDNNHEVMPAVYWECFREGYDDLRYLYTLQNAIVQRRNTTYKKCQQLINEGMSLIQEIWDSITPQQKYLNTDMWTDNTFNARRWQIATLTEKILAFPITNKNSAPSVLATTTQTKAKNNDNNFITECLNKGYIIQYDLAADNYKNWSPSDKEASIKITPGKGGKSPILHFNVHVDHNIDGCRKGGIYPVGWPRIRHNFKKMQLDITKYDYLYFKVKIDSNRSEVADDTTPFTFNISSFSGASFDKYLDLGGKQRVWIPITVSLKEMLISTGRNMSDWKNLKHIQFAIAEKNYAHNTQLRFDICDLAFLKFNRPIIKEIISDEIVILPVNNYLLNIRGYGFEDAIKEKMRLQASLTDANGKTVITEQFATTTPMQYQLNFETINLGSYKLTVSIADATGKQITEKSKYIKIISGF